MLLASKDRRNSPSMRCLIRMMNIMNIMNMNICKLSILYFLFSKYVMFYLVISEKLIGSV